MLLKRLRVQLKDVFIEFREEREKLIKQINVLKDYRNCLNSFVKSCKCDLNLMNGNKYLYNQLENRYLSAFNDFEPNIGFAESSSDTMNKENGVKDNPIVCANDSQLKTNSVDNNNELIEEIINENILDIDCRQLTDNCLVNEIQLEMIPKKEVDEEVIDLTEDEPMVETKCHSIRQPMIEEKIGSVEPKVFDIEEERLESVEPEAQLNGNPFSYLSSLITQPKNESQIEEKAGNSDKQNSGKTIVVEKNKRIFGFVCNIENCTEFYKSISGLQSHIDRLHTKQSHKPIKNSPIRTSVKPKTSSVKIGFNSDTKDRKDIGIKKTANARRVCPPKGIRRKGLKSNQNKPIKEELTEKPEKLLKYKCDRHECTASFGTKYQLIYHKIQNHKKGRSFRCKRPDCKLMFKSKYDVIQHLRMHSIGSTNEQKNIKSEKLRQFRCRFMDCELAFNTRSDLKQHKIESKHAITKPKVDNVFKCQSNGCDLSFESRVALRQHLRQTDHLKGRNNLIKSKSKPKAIALKSNKGKSIKSSEFKCHSDNCERSFKSRIALSQHLRRCDHKNRADVEKNTLNGLNGDKQSSDSHKTKQVFQCPKNGCNKEFKSMFALSIHSRRSDHKNDILTTRKTRDKKVCVRTDKQSSNSVETKQVFKCPKIGCNREFISRFALSQHLRRSVHKNDILRTRKTRDKKVCVRTVRQSSNSVKTKQVFKCPKIGCNAEFMSRFALSQHLRRSDHKNHKLPALKMKAPVVCVGPNEQAMNSDESKRVFKCANIECNTEFMSRFALNQHLKTCTAIKGLALKCEITGCKYRFTNRYKLKAHIIYDHKLDPLKCKECNQRFKTRSEKLNHFKNSH